MLTALRRCLMALGFLLLCLPLLSRAENTAIGVVLMHGKGGSPTKHVAELATALEARGYRVANLEMPWSGRRDYDVDVATAEREVEAALDSLRQKGAVKLFVAGHSQGGMFALYFGSRHVVDGIIAIAPGGDPSTPRFREALGPSMELAKKLVGEGKGFDKARFSDFEGSRGLFPVLTTPAIYLSWFAPEGEMNGMKAVRGMRPGVPVLYIAPTNDYPGLRKDKQQMFDGLPANPRSKLYEPSASHLGAPSASLGEIVEWTSAL